MNFEEFCSVKVVEFRGDEIWSERLIEIWEINVEVQAYYFRE